MRRIFRDATRPDAHTIAPPGRPGRTLRRLILVVLKRHTLADLVPSGKNTSNHNCAAALFSAMNFQSYTPFNSTNRPDEAGSATHRRDVEAVRPHEEEI